MPIKLLSVFVLVWKNEGSNIGQDGNVGKYTVNYFFQVDKKTSAQQIFCQSFSSDNAQMTP